MNNKVERNGVGTARLDIDIDIDALFPPGGQRFLAGILAFLLSEKLRSPKDVLEAWPDLMPLLTKEQRADILCGTKLCGIRQHALHKSPSSATEDVELALEHQLLKPEDILRYLPPKVRIERLGEPRLFAFFANGILEREPGKRSEMLAFALTHALDNALITATDIQHILTPMELVEYVQKTDLAELLGAIRAKGTAGEPFTADDFLGVIQVQQLVRDIPHEILWERCVLPLAKTRSWVASDEPAANVHTDIGNPVPEPIPDAPLEDVSMMEEDPVVIITPPPAAPKLDSVPPTTSGDDFPKS